MDDYSEIAVAIQHLQFDFGFGKSKVPILNNLNLSVEAGTIYGVLGPSGCGKTSLLKCIVGRLQPKKEKLMFFVMHLVRQIDLCLYQQLTISEILNYFGRLHHMIKGDVKKRIHYLIKFLDLPPGDRLIETLRNERKRTETNGNERKRTETNGNERKRTETNGNERKRTETNGHDEQKRTKTTINMTIYGH
uniref:ABC transporter domain-containing protein n=1 Tax=Strigamia maritima TaxID=126957 RepID=T1JP65_STRMM